MAKKNFTLSYGKGKVGFTINEKNIVGVLLPKQISSSKDEHALIKEALKKPIDSPALAEIISARDRIAVITSDVTRPTPSSKMLPPVLEVLKKAGAKKKNITIVFALGAHRKHTPQEQKKLIGERIYQEYRCQDHQKERCIPLGTTGQGIPVEIFEQVAEADKKICLGNIDPHYFAGYTGGVKSIMPGVSSKKSVSLTHKLMLAPGSCAGKIEGNPTREAIEEVGDRVGVDFILNVVLDPQKKVIAACAGDKTLAHRRGCKVADTCFKVPIKQKADVAIVSAGGHPKDINLYQAQKALDNAKYAVKQGGTIILVAQCPEGMGDKTFEEWVLQSSSPSDPVQRLREEFVLGGHKAAAIGMLLERVKVILVSSLPEQRVRKLFFTPVKSVDEAISKTIQDYGEKASFYLIPSGGVTLPSLEN